jgi:hypothetical protein
LFAVPRVIDGLTKKHSNKSHAEGTPRRGIGRAGVIEFNLVALATRAAQ